MNIQSFSLAKDGNKNISNNFKIKEFACNDGTDEILIDVDMIPILQKIRDVGGTVTINSAYRTIAHNKSVGGANNSYHTKGRAFDITAKNLSLNELCNLAYTLGVNGIIKYPTFVHIDSRDKIYHATNSGAKLRLAEYELPKNEEGVEEEMKRYNSIDEIPSYARETILKLVNKKILKGAENGLDLSDDMIRILVLNDRAKIYD